MTLSVWILRFFSNVLHRSSEEGSVSVIFPHVADILLSNELYNYWINYEFDDRSCTIPAAQKQQCSNFDQNWMFPLQKWSQSFPPRLIGLNEPCAGELQTSLVHFLTHSRSVCVDFWCSKKRTNRVAGGKVVLSTQDLLQTGFKYVRRLIDEPLTIMSGNYSLALPTDSQTLQPIRPNIFFAANLPAETHR